MSSDTKSQLSTEQYRLLLEASPDPIAIYDLQGNATYVNPAFVETFGWPSEELLGKRIDFVPEENMPETQQAIKQVFGPTGKVMGLDTRRFTKSGDILDIRLSAALFDDEAGNQAGLIVILRDITERKFAGKALHKVQAELETRVEERTREVSQVNTRLREEISERLRTEEELQKNIESQQVINKLLQISLEEISLDEQLERALNIILSPGWIATLPKGSIFLVEDDPEVLVLKAQRELSQSLLTKCARIPFGYCLCGRAAATGQAVFSDCLDRRHDVQYEGIAPHGHYNLPIHVDNKVAGVLNLYLNDGHEKNDAEIAFLEAVANTLAAMIKRHRTRQELTRLSTAVSQSGSVIYITDKDGVIEYVNPAFEKLTGYTQEEAIGQNPRILNSGKHPRSYFEKLWQTLLAGKVSRGVTINRKKSGALYYEEKTITPVKNEKGEITHFLATAQDISKRQQLEEQIQKSLELRGRQLAIGQAFATARTESDVIRAIVQEAGYYEQAAAAVFMLQQGSEQQVQELKVVDTFASGIKPLPIGTEILPSQMPLLLSPKSSFVSGNILEDERATPAMLHIANEAGFTSWVAFPIAAGGDWYGAVMAASKEENFFDDQKCSLYQSLAKQSAVALRGARLFDEVERSLERRSHQVQLSTQIAQEIATAPDLPHLYRRVVTLIKETFGYYHTQLLQYDPALDVMALVVGHGEIGEQMLALHHSMPIGVGLIGTAASNGRSILRRNVADDPYWQSNVLLPDTKSELAVPIKLGDDVLGVLDVQSDRAGALNENDQLLLEGLCGQIAAAIESTRLREEMADRLRELTTLQRYMSREGWQTYQANKPQNTGFRFDQAGVQPLAEAPNQPPKKVASRPNNAQGAAAPLAKTENTKSIQQTVNLPLIVRGEMIGDLGIEEDSQRPLSSEETEFLNAVAEQVAEALESARLFEQTQGALTGQERLAAELRTVAEVSTVASTILDVDNLLKTVVDLVKSRFDLYHAHVYLVDETGENLALRAGAGDVGQIMVLEGRTIRFDAESLVSRSARTRKSFIENDVRKIVDFLPHPLLPHTKAEMVIPLIVGGQLIGVMDLQADQVGFFTEDAMHVQRTLASQVAVAVHNATLYADQVETSSKLRQVDKLKSEFLASMSHELRTPLNSIIGFADVLLEGLDGDLNGRMEQDVRLIRDSGAHLRDLIGEILDMSKIEAGRMELRYEDIDMRQLANDILATAHPLVQEKNLELILDLSDDVGTILADRTRLRQVLWNIMGNAIKFTEKGSVTLAMKMDKDMLLVAVRDTGIGINPEDMSVVFEQFQQVDGSLNRSVGGTGLGMPITKKLIELHGGEIGVDSVPGQGSTFWFTIPKNEQVSVRQKLKTGPLPSLEP